MPPISEEDKRDLVDRVREIMRESPDLFEALANDDPSLIQEDGEDNDRAKDN